MPKRTRGHATRLGAYGVDEGAHLECFVCVARLWLCTGVGFVGKTTAAQSNSSVTLGSRRRTRAPGVGLDGTRIEVREFEDERAGTMGVGALQFEEADATE